MFGTGYWDGPIVVLTVMNPFSAGRSGGTEQPTDDGFETWDTFEPDTVPAPGPFLEGHDVRTGDEHAAFHRLTRDLFEERGVYDATFGYNLARLNLDRRHPDAGFRYAVDADDPSVLRAEFTPTTAFCPQATALVKGSFRAWNGLGDRHEFDLVRVRVRPSHRRAESLNESLEALETRFRESGEIPREPIEEIPAGDAERNENEGESSNRSPF